MAQAVYTYEGLSKASDGFGAPAYQILVGGQDLEKALSRRALELSVILDTRGEESASFQVSNCYDAEARAVDQKVKKLLKPGTKLEVKLGYGACLTSVFMGYIDELAIEMSSEESFSCEVKCCDVKKLMREGGERNREFETTKYTDVFKKIAGEYGSLCKVETGTEKAAEKPFTVKQTMGNLDFIEKKLLEAGLGDWELSITGGVACLVPKKKDEPPLLELGPGSGLLSFSWSYHYLNKKIQVQGFTYRQPNGVILVEGSVKAAFLEDFPPETLEFVTSGKASKAELEAVLAGKIKGYTQNTRSANISCIGLPQLQPGKKLQLKDIDDDINGIYTIRHVSHTMNDSGFVTSMTIGG